MPKPTTASSGEEQPPLLRRRRLTMLSGPVVENHEPEVSHWPRYTTTVLVLWKIEGAHDRRVRIERNTLPMGFAVLLSHCIPLSTEPCGQRR